jgi:IS1 family transposase
LLHDLQCGHLQLDELVTRVRTFVHRVWVWVAVDASTKLITMVHLGRRKCDDAMLFVHGLMARLAAGCMPIITTNGLSAYLTAITAHFGRFSDEPGQRKPVWQVDPRLLYGRLHKVRQGRKLKYAMTAVNLFLRETIAPLSRRTWSLAQTPARLAGYLDWVTGCYYLVRPHEALRLPTRRGYYRQRTPAMAAGISSRPWQIRDLLACHLA